MTAANLIFTTIAHRPSSSLAIGDTGGKGGYGLNVILVQDYDVMFIFVQYIYTRLDTDRSSSRSRSPKILSFVPSVAALSVATSRWLPLFF